MMGRGRLLFVGSDDYIPTRVHDEDAGVDLKATETTVIAPGQPRVISLGVAVQIPNGCFGLLTHRSSLAFKKNCILSTGVIDSNYTGVIKCKVFNMGSENVTIEKGERIAQLIVQSYRNLTPHSVDTLAKTTRGDGGFGSTDTESTIKGRD